MVTEGRRYRVLSMLGKGGFGTVYRAELLGEGGFSKQVAIKVLNPDMDDVEDVAARLRDEARVLGLLRHRAIVQVDGLVRLDGRWTVVMEYVEGVDLKQLMSATGPFPVGPALEIVGETAAALHAAYTRAGPDGRELRLLHRDIKPSNIQLTSAGETKLLDFGVARADFASREAETRSLMFGSVGYMAPERLDFIDGPGGDVYALGAVLYEMLAGVPFGKTSSQEARHRSRLERALDALAPTGVPEPVLEVIKGMMDYEPAARPTARDVERRCRELARALAEQPLQDWAETCVLPLLAEPPRDPGELSGSILIEHSGSSQSLPPPVTPLPTPSLPAADSTPAPGPSPDARASNTGAWAAGIAVAVLLALGVVTLVTLVVLYPTEEGPSGSSTDAGSGPATEMVAASDPVAASPAEANAPTPETVVTTAASVSTAPTEASSPSPRTRARVESATPAVSASETAIPDATAGLVTVSGDAREVVLVGPGGRLAPGSVPPGDYRIDAAFGDGPLVVAGQVQVTRGAEAHLQCSSTFTRCLVK